MSHSEANRTKLVNPSPKNPDTDMTINNSISNDNCSSLENSKSKCKPPQHIGNLTINKSHLKCSKTGLKMNPVALMYKKASQWNVSMESVEFAQLMDKEDPLGRFRKMFVFPKKRDLPNIDLDWVKDSDEECIYLCGQSLGLKPKDTDRNVQKVLDNWAQKGVHSHFNGYLPAALSDLPPKRPMAKMVGAKEHEIAILNGLTVNLHLLLATFYRPDSERYKLMIEDHAFPSDTGENLLNEDDILKIFEEQGDQIKVALLPAVQYYTGQLLNVEKLTAAAQKKGIIVGVDLAHAVGNVPIYLDRWNVDFAAWCTYKYMNSGAGGMAGIYVNERFFGTELMPAYQGWWGNNVKTKFLMREEFDPAPGADMFKLSNPSPVLNAMLMTSLEIFEQTSMEELRQKEYLLTGYLEFMIKSFFPQTVKHKQQTDETTNKDQRQISKELLMPSIEIITPSDPEQRGAQLSLIFSVPLSIIHEQFQKRGIVCDIRMPSVMRVAPTPLYNSFTDVYKLITTLHDIFQNMDSFEVNAAAAAADNDSLIVQDTLQPEDEQGYSSISSDSEAESSAGIV